MYLPLSFVTFFAFSIFSLFLPFLFKHIFLFFSWEKRLLEKNFSILLSIQPEGRVLNFFSGSQRFFLFVSFPRRQALFGQAEILCQIQSCFEINEQKYIHIGMFSLFAFKNFFFFYFFVRKKGPLDNTLYQYYYENCDFFSYFVFSVSFTSLRAITRPDCVYVNIKQLTWSNSISHYLKRPKFLDRNLAFISDV